MRKADQHQGLPTFAVCQYQPAHLRPDASGCTNFQGEDHGELDRKKSMYAEQKAYLLKQMDEKKQKKAMLREQDLNFDR